MAGLRSRATKRVLLTGATGFLGRRVMAEMARRGHDVLCVIRRGTAGRLPAGASDVVESDDIFAESEDWWFERMEGVDLVAHVAWHAGQGDYLHSEGNLDCLVGTTIMAKAVARSGALRFAGVGSCYEYEFGEEDLTVDSPLNPATPYAAAKISAWQTLRSYLRLRGVSFVWARPFFVHGEGEHEQRLASYLRRQLGRGEPAELSHGRQVRDFIEVGEAAGQLVSDATGSGEGATNICTGRGITVRSFAEAIADEYGRRDLLRFGARPENPVDPRRIVGVRSAMRE